MALWRRLRDYRRQEFVADVPLPAWIGIALLVSLASCGARDSDVSAIGDPQAGATVITRKACGSCHEIPGIEEATGMVGPSLRHFASRQMIAGTLPNSPQNLFRYLKSPQSIVKGNYMPDQGMSNQQVRDVAAFLYTRE